MTNAALLASRFARRPLLMEIEAARAILSRLAEIDPRGLVRESRLDAVRKSVV